MYTADFYYFPRVWSAPYDIHERPEVSGSSPNPIARALNSVAGATDRLGDMFSTVHHAASIRAI